MLQRMAQNPPSYLSPQDLIIPGFKPPSHYTHSVIMGSAGNPEDYEPQRNTLLFLRGDVGAGRKWPYSRRIRQKLHQLTHAHNWTERFSVKIGGAEDVPGDYSELLSTSLFCVVAPGVSGGRC